MATIKVGDVIPEGTFSHIPHAPELESLAACGVRMWLLHLILYLVKG